MIAPAALRCPHCGIPVEEDGLCISCWDDNIENQARPEVKAYRAAYRQRPEVKAYQAVKIKKRQIAAADAKAARLRAEIEGLT